LRIRPSNSASQRGRGQRGLERHVAHRQAQATGNAGIDQALHRAGHPCGFIAHAFEVANGLGDGDQQAQVTRRRLTTRNDGRQIGVDVELHLVHALFADQHGAGRLATEMGQGVDGLRHLRFHQAAHFQHAGRNAAELVVELAGEVLFRHVLVFLICSVHAAIGQAYFNRSGR